MEYRAKLERINDIINNKGNKYKQVVEETSFLNFLSLDKTSKKLLKHNINKFEQKLKSDEISDKNIIINYKIDKKKLNIVRIYINIAWGVILLRYIDILVRVKHGGNLSITKDSITIARWHCHIIFSINILLTWNL
jgi:hypothetical protein